MTKATLPLLALAALLASCQWPLAQSSSSGGGVTKLLVSFAPRARTVVADLANAPIASYALTLSDPTSTFQTRTGTATPGGSYSFSNIEIATWSLSVIAKDASGNTLGTGLMTIPSTDLILGATKTITIPITFSTAGTGGLSFTIDFPAATSSGSTIDYVSATLTQWVGGVPTDLTSLLGASATGTVSPHTFSASGLPSGANLDLVMTFRSNGASGTPLGTYTESINIWDNQTSSSWIDQTGLVGQRTFAASDFFDSNALLANLELSSTSDMLSPPPGSSFSFSSSTFTYDVVVPSTVTSGYFRPTASVDGQTIKYSTDNSTFIDSPSSSISPAIATGGASPTNLWVRALAPDHSTTHTYQLTFTTGYSVTYDPNGATSGDVPTDSSLYVAGSGALTLGNLGALDRSGWLFLGWNTMPDGTGTFYSAGAGTYVFPASGATDLTLYAEWAPRTAIVESFNGASWYPTFATAVPVQSPAITLTADGSRFYVLSGTELLATVDGLWSSSGVPPIPPTGTLALTVMQSGEWVAATSTNLYLFQGALWQSIAQPPAGVSIVGIADGIDGVVILGSDGMIRLFDGSSWSNFGSAPAGTTAIMINPLDGSFYALSGSTLWLWNSGVWMVSGIPAPPTGTTAGMAFLNGSLYALVIQ